jgi:probable rRNA maturation factor
MSPPRLERICVEFTVEDGVNGTWDEAKIAALARAIIARELTQNDYVIALHLVGDESIRRLNATHRGQDIHTDVLSFPLDAARSADFVLPPNEPANLGDVVISYPRAAEQATEFGHSTDREVAYLVAHGVLHVLGYDHEAEPDKIRMRQREEEALQPLGFTR